MLVYQTRSGREYGLAIFEKELLQPQEESFIPSGSFRDLGDADRLYFRPSEGSRWVRRCLFSSLLDHS